MRSGTSFFDLTIYRKTLQWYWPIMAINFVVWFIALPLNTLMRWPEDQYSTGFLRFVSRSILDACGRVPIYTIGFAVVAGLLTAMAVCSHLYHSRSANFMAALPVRRESQFLSAYLAGLTMLVLPNVVNFLLMVIIEAAAGTLVIAPIAFWLLYQSVLNFFFYSFAACIGMFTGHIIALPVYYAVFNAIVAGAWLLFTWIMEAFFFGFSSSGWISPSLVMWLTPVAALNGVALRGISFESSGTKFDMDPNSFGNYGWAEDVAPTAYYAGYQIDGGLVLLVYAIVAVVLVVCSVLLYRKRRMESAGDAVAVKAMKPVFRYGVAICMGVCLGLATAAVLNFSELGIMISMLIWGVIGAFVAQMFLDKSFRVFKKWKGAVGTAVFFLLVFAAIGFDFTGFETRVPEPANVESVEVDGLQAYPYDSGASLYGDFTDPEIIKAVTALHEAVVAYGPEGETGDYARTMNLTLTYHLKSGGTMKRSYYVTAGETLLGLGQDIWDMDEVRYRAYGLDRLESWAAEGGRLNWATIYQNGADVLEIADAQPLWDAVMADFDAGRIGVHLMERGDEWYEDEEPSAQRTIYEVEFAWIRPHKGQSQQIHDVGIPTDKPYMEMESESFYLQFAVQESSTETLRVIEALLETNDMTSTDLPQG